MDPLKLLKELYGDEPVRKILSSGFDSLGKISAATPESLSFFAGIQEALARQIIRSAEEGRGGNPAGKSSAQSAGDVAILPRELPRAAARKEEPERALSVRVDPLDDHPLLDAGGVLKSLSREPHPNEFLNDDNFLEEVGLSHAEAGFLQGISPWSESPDRERMSPLAFETHPAPEVNGPAREEMEFAPISNWTPEAEPDPVPRIIRAPELGPDLSHQEDGRSGNEPPAQEACSPTEALPTQKLAAPSTTRKPSFWKFGR